MEPVNNEFQSSTTEFHSFPKKRNKLSSKHRGKLQCKKENHVEVLFSPVSHCFKRNASTVVANSVSAVCGEDDHVAKAENSDPLESCMSELSKHTATTGAKYKRSSEQTVNTTMCFNSESASETRKLNFNVNKSSLDSSCVKIIQVADVEGKAASADEDCVQEFRNITKHDCGVTETIYDDASNKSRSVSLVKLNGIEVESALDCMSEVHISCEDATRRHFKCPLCWKFFEKNQALNLHMKGCAARHNITTRQLLSALALHARQAAERQALGLPDIPTTYTTKKSLKKSGKDSNLQLALALSASLQEAEDREQLEQDDCLLEAGLGHEVVEQQKLMWERFGFMRSNPAIPPPASSRQKPACKRGIGDSVLMRRTKEEREMLITEKVAIILMGNDSIPVCTAVNIPHDTHSVAGLVDPTENLQKFQNEACLLWNMASASCSEKELESYYVKELTKFISPSKVSVGSKLKHLSQIPGRSKTPEKGSCSPVIKVQLAQLTSGPEKQTETAEHRDPEAKQSFVASLTDESICKDSLAETLISDWKSVLNKKVMSDLTIYVEKDLEIPAHKLVLYVRCRAILKDVVSEVSVETNKKISDMLLWVDVSYRAALAFLHFIYCGITSKILHLEEVDLFNVKRLAERYHVSELLHYLRVVSGVRDRVKKSRNSSFYSTVPHDNITDRRKHNSLHERNPSNQCARSEAVSPPQKQMYASNTFNSHDSSAELSERGVCSETDSKHFHKFAEPGLGSRVSTHTDLFIKDFEGSDVKPLTQDSSSSMAYLIDMIYQPSLSQSNTQISAAEVSSDKLLQSNTEISYLQMPMDKLSQSNTQVSSSQMSSDKLCPTISSVVHHSPTRQNSVKGSDCEISTPSDMQMTSVSHSRNKCVASHTDLMCADRAYNNQHDFFFSSSVASRNHTYTSDNMSNSSIVKAEAQINTLVKNSVKLEQSSQSEICSERQPSSRIKLEVESAFDGINFHEHLLSDPHTRTSSTCVQADVKELVEVKRKHPESGTVSDHCSSYTKKICRDRVEIEAIKTFTNKLELNEKSDTLIKSEKDMEVFDLTQNSTDSEFTKSQDPLLIPQVRESLVDTNIESGKNSTTECTDVTICNNLLIISEEHQTSDKTSECKYFDSAGETRGEGSIIGVNKIHVEEERDMQFNNKQISHEWDEFDEMCHASVPQIFSQCLLQLLSSQSTAQKSPRSGTSSQKSEISQCSSTKSLNLSPRPESLIRGPLKSRSSSRGRKRKKMSKSVEGLPPVFQSQKSPTVNEIVENSLLAQLNESVFWRDENAPKQAVTTDNCNILGHRTPIQTPATVSFSDTVTPPADYSTMKTPQLKKELKKYGLKPSLTKRQAKTMLRYIYNQLHPYITVSDSEDDTQMTEMESDTDVPRSPVRSADILGASRSPVRRNIMTAEVTSYRRNLVRERRKKASQSDAGSDSDDLLSSQERFSSSEVTVTEEAFCEELDVCNEGDICLSQDDNLATVVHSFITSDPKLHQKVLLYEPIWIEQLHADLKANNFKFKLRQLMDYLDEQCITFRTAHGQRSRKKLQDENPPKRKEKTQ